MTTLSRDKPVLAVKQIEYFDGKPYNLEVHIDWVAIIRNLGKRAVANKRGKAALLYGAVTVKVSK